ncbi:Piso0_002621 [Millerozyma farinosa CBS 7064]|uniref:Piso0_002621 protein n=1 Tax=Pichia sorbitophila (strain ATCC MYA-4447 / BCRC 22081 / CBS 7064 / NBRC 10061 / NRRL Y-12695) TaxID=559304 RepID=G8YD38_PICSO|nr:Piso0_002621 [Millerozyma farinosa CBS 7064]
MNSSVIHRALRYSVLSRASVPRVLHSNGARITYRGLKSSSRIFQESDSEKAARIISVFRENPDIRASLEDLQSKLAKKGITPDGKQPSLMQMMKLLTDGEVKQSLIGFKAVLDKSNVKIDQGDIDALMSMYGLKK